MRIGINNCKYQLLENEHNDLATCKKDRKGLKGAKRITKKDPWHEVCYYLICGFPIPSNLADVLKD